MDNASEGAEGPPKKPVVAVQRGVAVLRCLAGRTAPAGVSEIARVTGTVPSTCLHILRTLVHEGLVQVDPATKRYRLGTGVLALARAVVETSPFVAAAQPALDALARRQAVTMTATELDRAGHMVVVAIARAAINMSIRVNVGSRFPALISASGRCFAAHSGWSEAQLADRFRRLRWQDPPAFEDWLEEVAAARTNGFALDDGQYIRGIAIAAAPVFGADGRADRALAAVGLADQLRGPALERLGQEVRDAARAVSAALRAAA